MASQEDTDIADIKAEVQKHESRLIFTGIVLFMCLIGFSIKTCASRPPEPVPPNPSIECAKIVGAEWIPIEHKVINGRILEVAGYCSTKK